MIINNTVGRGGSSGKDGITPHIGDNGNWFLGTEDTGVIAKAQSNTNIVTITLLASGWSADNTQTVSCTGISADEASQNIDISPALEDQDKYMNAGISCIGFAEDSLTFTADTIPTEDILVYVAIEETGGATSNDVYSTEETVVGTWIDGKPIYRIVIIGTTPSTVNTVQATTFPCSNMESLVSTKGYIDGSVSYPIVRRPITDASAITIWPTSVGSLNMQIMAADYVNRPFYLVVEYTKTTDTATIEIPSATALAEAYEEGVNDA